MTDYLGRKMASGNLAFRLIWSFLMLSRHAGFFLTVLLFVFGLNRPLVAQDFTGGPVVPSVDIFTVEGETLRDVVREITEYIFSISGNPSGTARTQEVARWSWAERTISQQEKAVTVEEYTWTIVVDFPEWKQRAELPDDDPCAQEWDRWIAQTTTHEQFHVDTKNTGHEGVRAYLLSMDPLIVPIEATTEEINQRIIELILGHPSYIEMEKKNSDYHLPYDPIGNPIGARGGPRGGPNDQTDLDENVRCGQGR